MPTRGSAENGFRKLSRLALANVPKNQADRPADCGVGPVTGSAEGSLGVVKSKFPDHGSADNGERRTTERAALGAQNMERWVQHRLQSGKYDRYILRLAAGHGTVNGDLLDSCDSLARRNDAEYFVG